MKAQVSRSGSSMAEHYLLPPPYRRSMTARVELPESPVAMEPGVAAVCPARISNIGFRPDRFTLEPVGSAASWTTIDPPVLMLPAGGMADVSIRFRPPRAPHVRAGDIPFAVVATSERDRSSAVTEQLLTLSRFVDTELDLQPKVLRGRSGRYRLSVTNGGNDTVRLLLRGRDLAGLLRVECEPHEISVFPGHVERVRVRVRLHGGTDLATTKPMAFQVVAQPPGADPILALGRFVPHYRRFAWVAWESVR